MEQRYDVRSSKIGIEFVMNPIIKLSDNAASRIKEIMANAEKDSIGVRVSVKSGGCAGMSYVMEYTKELNPNDEVIEDKGVKVFVDSGTNILASDSRSISFVSASNIKRVSLFTSTSLNIAMASQRNSGCLSIYFRKSFTPCFLRLSMAILKSE